MDAIKRELDWWLSVYDDPELFRSIGGDPAAIRSHFERKIARIYAQVMGVDPQKKKRLALMERLNRLAAHEPKTNHDPKLLRLLSAAESTTQAKSSGLAALVVSQMTDPFSEISDEELAPVIEVWKSGPGAKAGGAVGKWRALSRVLQRHADGTKPSTLAREAREARQARNARAKGKAARNHG